MPKHKGLSIILNIFKTDIIPNTSMVVQILDESQPMSTEVVNLFNKENGVTVTAGSNICEGDGNEMIYTYLFTSLTHNSRKNLAVTVTAPGGGIFIRELEVYLGNCDECFKNQLNFDVNYLPRYSFQEN